MGKIKFGTDGWRAIIGDQFTLANLSRVTEGTVSYLKDNFKDPKVMIGYDCRFNGRLFAEHVATVFAENGVQVFISNSFASTPMVSLSTNKRQGDLGIVITASHNPPEYSGYKVKSSAGGPAIPSVVADIESRIPDTTREYHNRFEDLCESGNILYFDMEAVYLNHIKENCDVKLLRSSSMKVGYDAMFGAGQHVISKILPYATLLHCDFNPSFQGTAPEPIEKNLTEFQALIRAKGLDLGIATDGDADRIGVFDERGEFVDSHHIILLLVHYLHKVKGLSGKVVSTFSCTEKINKLCQMYGLPHETTKVGFKYICEIMLNENVLVGGEESGGIAVTGHVPERDGIYIGLMILEMMAKTGKSLTGLVEEIYGLVGSFSYGRNDLHLPEPQKQYVIQQCRDGQYDTLGGQKVLRTEDLDGFKFHLPEEQWVMIRPSGTEPVLRIYAESATREKVDQLLADVVADILQHAAEVYRA
ncbi:MAG: phosphoglucomutase/phosphomannomutase family protein [Bacteroidia bacterium]|nr:phosphoglucomutase/phosphomannomutase family protein [Bacteroidia bacterium]